MLPLQQQLSGQLYGLDQSKIEKQKNWVYFAKNPTYTEKHQIVNDNFNLNSDSRVL